MSGVEKPEVRAGRTLLVKPRDGFEKSVLEGLDGCENTFYSEKSETYFLTFDSVEHAQSVHNSLMDNESCRVKYAHYRVFFKVDGLDESSCYDDVKKSHSEWVSSETGARVLYYKLYKKKGTQEFLGSGDMTIDTKEGFDALLNRKDGGKHCYEGGEVKARHYRYNKKQ